VIISISLVAVVVDVFCDRSVIGDMDCCYHDGFIRKFLLSQSVISTEHLNKLGT
jgi:hypothetical protein